MFFDEFERLQDILNDSKQYGLLRSIMEHIPGPVFLLDPNHRLVAINQECEKVYGVNNDHAIGELQGNLPFKGSLLGKEFLKSDKKALTGMPAKNFSVHSCSEYMGLQSYMISKKPIYNEKKKIIGIWAQGIDVAELFANSFRLFWEYSSRYYPNKIEQFVIDLDSYYEHLDLTRRQSEVFFFLLRGKTGKEIAEILSLSVLTVESYINHLKNKLDCSTKSQLVEKAIAAGYLGILPETLLCHLEQRKSRGVL